MRGVLGAWWMVAAVALFGVAGPWGGVASGQTIVGGFIRQDTTWTPAGSPYMVRSTVEVTDGAVLTIEPGVEVVFDDRQGLDSTNGVLIADGQGGDRIVFRSASGAARSWSGITTSSGVSSVTTPEGDYASGPIFRNVRIVDADGAVRGHTRPVHFEDVVIERCGSLAIQIRDRQSDSTIWFKGVTVRASGVGLAMSEARRVMLLDCVFEDNAGGGVQIIRGSGEMARCAFRRNGLTSVTFGGGGAYLGRGGWDIRDCVFEGNEAVNTSTGSGGGGLYLSTFFSTITDCDFIANTSTVAGGGAEVRPADTGSTLRVERCRFVDNESLESSGGGLLAGAGTLSTLFLVEVVDCAFEGNHGDRNGGLVLGLHSGEVSGSTFDRNTARTSGGALRIYNQVTDLLIHDNEFVDNATEAAGGAIDLTSIVSSRGLRIEDNAFRGNTADTGGAIGGLGPSSIGLAGNTFEGNSARLGGAVHVRSGAFDAVSLAGGVPNRFSGNMANVGATIYNDSALAIDATGNCWGTDDLAAIADSIFDASDDPTKGAVAFDPIATACDACPADLDGDGELTIFDFLAFGNLFDLMDTRADFDGDGAFTIFDFLAFQNAFDAGC